MDHTTIQDQELIRRYVQASLDAAVQARFEAHIVTCTACQEAIAWEEDMHAAMHAAAAEDVLRAQQVSAMGLFAWLARQGAIRRALAIAAVAVVAALPAIGWWWERDAHRTTLARIEAPPAADGAQPQVNMPLYYLDTVRGDDAPVTRWPRPAASEPVIMVLELDSSFADHRAVLERDGTVVWQADGLKANDLGAFVIQLPSGFLAPGRYQLRLDGLRDGVPTTTVGRSAFEVADGR